jgi:hypothetical protein
MKHTKETEQAVLRYSLRYGLNIVRIHKKSPTFQSGIFFSQLYCLTIFVLYRFVFVWM